MRIKGGVLRWVVISLAAFALVAAIAAAYILNLPQFGARPSGERLARIQASALYKDGAFANPLPPAAYTLSDAWEIFRGQFFGGEVRVPRGVIPVRGLAPELVKDLPP